jgi:hypothetical protein
MVSFSKFANFVVLKQRFLQLYKKPHGLVKKAKGNFQSEG